jgi:hypothetical protein
LDADVHLTAGHDLGSVWFEPHAARPDQHGCSRTRRLPSHTARSPRGDAFNIRLMFGRRTVR